MRLSRVKITVKIDEYKAAYVRQVRDYARTP